MNPVLHLPDVVSTPGRIRPLPSASAAVDNACGGRILARDNRLRFSLRVGLHGRHWRCVSIISRKVPIVSIRPSAYANGRPLLPRSSPPGPRRHPPHGDGPPPGDVSLVYLPVGERPPAPAGRLWLLAPLADLLVPPPGVPWSLIFLIFSLLAAIGAGLEPVQFGLEFFRTCIARSSPPPPGRTGASAWAYPLPRSRSSLKP